MNFCRSGQTPALTAARTDCLHKIQRRPRRRLYPTHPSPRGDLRRVEPKTERAHTCPIVHPTFESGHDLPTLHLFQNRSNKRDNQRTQALPIMKTQMSIKHVIKIQHRIKSVLQQPEKVKKYKTEKTKSTSHTCNPHARAPRGLYQDPRWALARHELAGKRARGASPRPATRDAARH